MNKCYLVEIEDLKEEYEKEPEEFIYRYSKKDFFIGSHESVEFVEKILKEKRVKN